MITEDQSPLILKLGGSVVSHSNRKIDFDYLREFRDLLREHILRGRKFVIIAGGGQTCREYMDLAMEQGNVTNERDLHMIGATVNTLHAMVIRGFLGDEVAEADVWKFNDVNRLKELPFTKPIVVAGGFQAGVSSDWCALQIAKAWGAKKVFDMKNVDGVYSEDPKQNSNAKKFDKLTWPKYIELIGNPEGHKPGSHLPVDVVAAREAKEIGMEYFILKANDFHNLDNAINGEEFAGTIIS